jgi:hypothetical protein
MASTNVKLPKGFKYLSFFMYVTTVDTGIYCQARVRIGSVYSPESSITFEAYVDISTLSGSQDVCIQGKGSGADSIYAGKRSLLALCTR